MKKLGIMIACISIIPTVGMAENPKITQLIKQKQQKMEQLEKCTGATKGLKIAGISTLGLTAVGVAGNIWEATEINKNKGTISNLDTQIGNTQEEIDKKKEKIAADAAAAAEAERTARTLSNVVAQDIADISSGGFYLGSQAKTHGYTYNQLPLALSSQFRAAMSKFISNCRRLIGENGVTEVSLKEDDANNYGSSGTILPADSILSDLVEHVVATCQVTECESSTHVKAEENGVTVCKLKQGDAEGPKGADGPEETPEDEEVSAEEDKIGMDCKSNGATKAVYKKIGDKVKCVATECDESKGYELARNAKGSSNGYCKKKSAAKPEDATTPVASPEEECKKRPDIQEWRGDRCACKNGGDIATGCKKCVSGNTEVIAGRSSEVKCSEIASNSSEVKQNSGTGDVCYRSCVLLEGREDPVFYYSVKRCPVGDREIQFTNEDQRGIITPLRGVKRCESSTSSGGNALKETSCVGRDLSGETLSYYVENHKLFTTVDGMTYSVDSVATAKAFEGGSADRQQLENELKKACYRNISLQQDLTHKVSVQQQEVVPAAGTPIQIPDFSKTKANLNRGKALAYLYGEKNNLNLDCGGSSFEKRKLDDYLTCNASGGEKYEFHFDSLTENTDTSSIVDAVCRLYGGSTTTHLQGGRRICVGMQTSLCGHMNNSIKKVLPNASAGLYNDGSEKCVVSYN